MSFILLFFISSIFAQNFNDYKKCYSELRVTNMDTNWNDGHRILEGYILLPLENSSFALINSTSVQTYSYKDMRPEMDNNFKTYYLLIKLSNFIEHRLLIQTDLNGRITSAKLNPPLPTSSNLRNNLQNISVNEIKYITNSEEALKGFVYDYLFDGHLGLMNQINYSVPPSITLELQEMRKKIREWHVQKDQFCRETYREDNGVRVLVPIDNDLCTPDHLHEKELELLNGSINIIKKDPVLTRAIVNYVQNQVKNVNQASRAARAQTYSSAQSSNSNISITILDTVLLRWASSLSEYYLHQMAFISAPQFNATRNQRVTFLKNTIKKAVSACASIPVVKTKINEEIQKLGSI